MDRFLSDRETPAYQAAFDAPEPLITVCVATYNRADLLTRRCLPSLMRQTYKRLEILVVGDSCTDDTAERIASLGDARIRFENLPQRGVYPSEPTLRWMVAGTIPINHALSRARGEWITHLDDDDEHALHRVEELLALVRAQRADIAFHPFDFERADGSWGRNPADAFRKSRVSTSSIFYHSWFKCVPWDLAAYQHREPGDWNRLRKIRYLGARTACHPESLLKHFREQSNSR